jgi:hypothetical protein
MARAAEKPIRERTPYDRGPTAAGRGAPDTRPDRMADEITAAPMAARNGD